MKRDPWQVATLAYEGLCTFEFGLAVEVFGLPRPEHDPWYSFRVCALEKGPLRATGGVTIAADARGKRFQSLSGLDHAGTIILPGWRDPGEPAPERLVRKLQRAHDEGARLLSICSGAFLLAATGLLDGERATTHWRYADQLARDFPAIDVDPDVLYVDGGNVLTSAGSAAGIDLLLHLVRRDCGAEVANAVARRLVVQPHRAGGQKQFIERPVAADAEGERLASVCDRLRRELAHPHTLASMASLAKMSERTFARRFSAQVGTTPHRWLIRERVLFAQRLLETTHLSMDEIAERAGFTDPQLLRLHFKRHVGTPPTAYRKSFRRA